MNAATNETNVASHQFIALGDYQAWAAENWIHAAGSQEFQLHSREKLREETSEVIAELRSSNPGALRSEVGDWLWMATTTASNGGITLEESLRTAHPGAFGYEGPITIAAIDYAVEDWPHTANKVLERELADPAATLGQAAKQWHALKEHIDAEAKPQGFADAWILLKAQRARYALAEIILLASHIAQDRLGLSLADIMEDNYQKLSGRIARGEAVTNPHKHNRPYL